MPAEKPFPQMKKGQPPSMIDADVANPVIDSCAAFNSMTILPAGTLKVAGRTAVLDLTRSGVAGAGELTFTFCQNGEATDYILSGRLA